MNLIRCLVLRVLDVAQDRPCAVDSIPVSVVQFHLVPGASREWAAHGAPFGTVVTKQQTMFGYNLHVLVTLNGVILDVHVAPAHVPDLRVGAEMLLEHTDLTVLGDTGYISVPLASELAATTGTRLLTPPRQNQRQQLPPEGMRLLTAERQSIEPVHDQLCCALACRHQACVQLLGLVRPVVYQTRGAYVVHLPQSPAWERRLLTN